MTKIEMQPIESIETRHFLAPLRAMRMREGSRARSLRTLSLVELLSVQQSNAPKILPQRRKRFEDFK
jgi:hypothetical protein